MYSLIKGVHRIFNLAGGVYVIRGGGEFPLILVGGRGGGGTVYDLPCRYINGLQFQSLPADICCIIVLDCIFVFIPDTQQEQRDAHKQKNYRQEHLIFVHPFFLHLEIVYIVPTELREKIKRILSKQKEQNKRFIDLLFNLSICKRIHLERFNLVKKSHKSLKEKVRTKNKYCWLNEHQVLRIIDTENYQDRSVIELENVERYYSWA